jgi:hypothetical protein
VHRSRASASGLLFGGGLSTIIAAVDRRSVAEGCVPTSYGPGRRSLGVQDQHLRALSLAFSRARINACMVGPPADRARHSLAQAEGL